MKVNDNVTRISYNHDIIFKITAINDSGIASLKGVFIRLFADAKIEDLKVVSDNDFNNANTEFEKLMNRTSNNIKKHKNYVTGKILHLDGDSHYLDSCRSFYKKLNIHANCHHIAEVHMPSSITQLLAYYRPDIVVITGHDNYNGKNIQDISNYKNSYHFIRTVETIRNTANNEQTIIIAGACQSNFDALIASGANFASSPMRVNIHCLDPAIIATFSSLTSLSKIINFNKILKYTFTQREGIGGIETYGKLKLLL